MSQTAPPANRVIRESLEYGMDSRGVVNPFTEQLLALERVPGITTQEKINIWESQVRLWASDVDAKAQIGVDARFEIPEYTEVTSAELAHTAIRLFRNRKYNDEEKTALNYVVEGAFNDFFPDEYYINRSQISDLLHATVITPVMVLMRFDTAIWRQREICAEAMK